MAGNTEFDLIVVGAGIAGLIAANRAADLGLSVAVLERGEEERYLCNSRFTGGFFHVAKHSVASPQEELRRAIDQATAGTCDPRLRDVLAGRIGPTVRWLANHGVRFVRGGPLDYQSHVLSPPGLRWPGLHWEGRAGDVLLRDMVGWLQQAGGILLRGHRAAKLHRNGRRVTGVEIERANGDVARLTGAVLLADGGFQGDAELVRKYISPCPQALLQRGAGTGRGDGLRLAASVGARLTGLDRFYGHVQCREAMETERLWPYPILDILSATGIVVDSCGRRFTDEGLGGIHTANAIARLDNPLSAVVIFDSAIWSDAGREFILAPNPVAINAGARLISVDRLSDLAQALSISGGALAATVASYNAACEFETLDKLNPPRTDMAHQPLPLKHPPYHALRACAGITYTMGGVVTDAGGRVISEDGEAIFGLYAAGCTTGGLEGGPRTGYAGGLSKATVFGLLAAEAAFSDCRHAAAPQLS